MDAGQLNIIVAAVAGLLGTALGSIVGPLLQQVWQDSRLRFAEEHSSEVFSIPLARIKDVQIKIGEKSFYSASEKRIRLFNPGSKVLGGVQIRFEWSGGPAIELTEKRGRGMTTALQFRDAEGPTDLGGEAPHAIELSLNPVEPKQLVDLRLTALRAARINVALIGVHFTRSEFAWCAKSPLGIFLGAEKYSPVRWGIANGLLFFFASQFFLGFLGQH